MEPVAFVILSYNSFQDATRLCKDLLGLPGSEGCRVILVDNASPDRRGYEEWADLADSRVIRVEAAKNCGYSVGNNLGIDLALEAGIDHVVVLNPDVQLLGRDTLLARIDQAYRELDFLVLGFSVNGIVPYFAALQTWALLFPLMARAFDRRKFRGLLRTNPLPEAFAVGRIYGCAFALRANRFRELGLFDESIFLYGEETIVSHVALANKTHVLQSMDLKIHHTALGSFSGNLSLRHLAWMSGSLARYLTDYRRWPRPFSKAIATMSMGQVAFSYWIGRHIRSSFRQSKD